MGYRDTEVGKGMVQERARKESELGIAKRVIFGDGDTAEMDNRKHGVAETTDGVAVGFRTAFFEKGHIVALFYWTGSCEREVTLDAAEAYAALLNEKCY